jgi:hypothetical protein
MLVCRYSEEELRTLLCVGAEGDDPATCAAAAPLYLTSIEKVHTSYL